MRACASRPGVAPGREAQARILGNHHALVYPADVRAPKGEILLCALAVAHAQRIDVERGAFPLRPAVLPGRVWRILLRDPPGRPAVGHQQSRFVPIQVKLVFKAAIVEQVHGFSSCRLPSSGVVTWWLTLDRARNDLQAPHPLGPRRSEVDERRAEL